MKRSSFAVCAVAAVATIAPAGADQAPGAAIGPGWAAFSAIASSYTDSELTVSATEDLNGRRSDDVILLQYKRPTLARCRILDDQTPGLTKNTGAEIVWRGGPKVQAHPGGKFSALVFVLDRTNAHVTDAIGFGCGQTSLDQTRDFFLTHGTVTETPGPVVGGIATTAETLVPSDVRADYGMTKQVLLLSKTTHLPVENLGYAGDKLVLDAKYSGVKINPGLPNSLFSLTESTAIK